MFKFGETIQIGFRIMIPHNASVTNDFYHPLQFWQCSPASPIGGLRIQRGSSHKLSFMTRGEKHDGNLASVELVPGVWHQVLLTVNANPNGDSLFRVSVDGKVLTTSTRPFGYTSNHRCPPSEKYSPEQKLKYSIPQHFRVKFGMYKKHEAGRYFEVNFDDLRISNRHRFATPF